ncbi:MAG: hypothetical protein ACRC9K_03150 [Afipia sp.]
MQRVKTLSDLNRHNRTQALASARKLTRLLANGEIATRTAANITLATISGSFFSNSHPPSLLSLAEAAERQVGAKKGSFARRHNAKHSRMGVWRIGPEVSFPEGAPTGSYRLERSIAGFYTEHVRNSPGIPRKKSWINLKIAIAAVTDDGAVTRFDPDRRNGEIDPRTESYSFKIGEKLHKISLGQFEKYFTEGRKPQEMVR